MTTEATASERHRTPFYDAQREFGATFIEVRERLEWPSEFGDPVAEHEAVRSSVGVLDASPVKRWEVTGPDALYAVDFLLANDLLGAAPGQARYGAFCDDRGKMLGDGVAYKVANDFVWLMTPNTSDLAHFIAVTGDFDVEFKNRTFDVAHLQVQGPASHRLLQSLTSQDLRRLKYFEFIPKTFDVAGVSAWISRTGYSGEFGYEVFCAAEDAGQLWKRVTDAGARPYGGIACESLRIEAGLIFVGFEYQQGEASPFEMNLDKVTRLDCADFHGRDALVAEFKGGGPPRRLVSLVLDETEQPAHAAPVYHTGKDVGRVTSPSQGVSPTVRKPFAIAVLAQELCKKGTRVEVEAAGRRIGAAVDDFPIYDPGKQRARTNPTDLGGDREN